MTLHARLRRMFKIWSAVGFVCVLVTLTLVISDVRMKGALAATIYGAWLLFVAMTFAFAVFALIASRISWLGTIDAPPRERRCPECGYDLRATPERCPECGAKPGGVVR